MYELPLDLRDYAWGFCYSSVQPSLDRVVTTNECENTVSLIVLFYLKLLQRLIYFNMKTGCAKLEVTILDFTELNDG